MIDHLLGKIHNTDCLAFMKQLPDKCIDLILTDPPYGINYQSNMRTRSDKFARIANDHDKDHVEYFRQFERILKHDCAAISFCSWKNVDDEKQQMEQFFDVKNIIVWHKPGGGIGDLEHSFSTDYELAVVGHKGQCKIRGKREGSVWTHMKVNPNAMVHPTEKPEGLIGRLVNAYSDEGAVVFDSFAGSGTTLVCAEKNKRLWMGCELEPKYCAIAYKRIDAEKSQLKLF
jgi:site-specific DNA-methyltransferase (adenine-specific)